MRPHPLDHIPTLEAAERFELSSSEVEDLEALLDGKPVRQKSLTVEAAVEEWLPFRSKNLSATTPDQAIKFRMSLPFRTGNSSSLSVAPLDREYSIFIPRIASPPLIRDKNRTR